MDLREPQHLYAMVVVVEKFLSRASPKHLAREVEQLARGGRCQPLGIWEEVRMSVYVRESSTPPYIGKGGQPPRPHMGAPSSPSFMWVVTPF